MYQAITTRYFGPGNVRGSRIKATSGGGLSVWIDYDDALNSEQNHAEAAQKLATTYGWSGRWFGGAIKDGYAFVMPSPAWTDDAMNITDRNREVAADIAAGGAFWVPEVQP